MRLSKSGGSVGAVHAVAGTNTVAVPAAALGRDAAPGVPRAEDVLGVFAPRTVSRFLIACVVGLTLMHVLVTYVWHVMGYDHAKGLVPLFYLDSESNAPTWFSSAMLLMAGFAALAIADRSRAGRGYWMAMGFIAVFLSFDESAQFHEMVSAALRGILSVGSGFSWAIVAVISVLPILLAVAIFHRFVRSLPRATTVGIVAAGAVYVMGVAGVDTIAAMVHAKQGGWLLQTSLNTVEELLEMLGVIMLIHVLLTHLGRTLRTEAEQVEGAAVA